MAKIELRKHQYTDRVGTEQALAHEDTDRNNNIPDLDLLDEPRDHQLIVGPGMKKESAPSSKR